MKLMTYMIPSFFIQMNSSLINANGKIEHNLLKEPNINELKSEYREPENDLQRKILEFLYDNRVYNFEELNKLAIKDQPLFSMQVYYIDYQLYPPNKVLTNHPVFITMDNKKETITKLKDASHKLINHYSAWESIIVLNDDLISKIPVPDNDNNGNIFQDTKIFSKRNYIEYRCAADRMNATMANVQIAATLLALSRYSNKKIAAIEWFYIGIL